MNEVEREGLKEQLRAMAAGRGDGIDLDSVNRWVIEGLREPIGFFRHLGSLVAPDSILYFEGSAIAPDVAQLYTRNRAANAICVVQDTIFPVPEVFHVSMTKEVIEGLIALLGHHSVEHCFHHVKAYRDGKLLFTFHDAFDGSYFLVSDRVAEVDVSAFSSALGVAYRREPNVNKRDPEQLRRFLWALENPEKLRMNWPWWKKALFFWKKTSIPVRRDNPGPQANDHN
jgi:hypothetical protein